MKKIKMIGLVCLFFFHRPLLAQELLNFTEPASNMPARSLGIRLTNSIFDDKHVGKIVDQFLPELMLGVNKNLMVHAEGIFSNSGGSFQPIGVGTYAKYRFYSIDKVHRHFRMAAFGRASINRGSIHFEELETNGMNSGWEAGFIGTQLLHKQAISLTLSYEQIFDNSNNNRIYNGNSFRGFNYALSTGRLILPRKYTSYKQLNLNVMLEFLGQYLPDNQKYYLDIAPSIQFIVQSQTRIDLGFRHQLNGNMDRMTTNSIMLRVEHLLFNVI